MASTETRCQPIGNQLAKGDQLRNNSKQTSNLRLSQNHLSTYSQLAINWHMTSTATPKGAVGVRAFSVSVGSSVCLCFPGTFDLYYDEFVLLFRQPTASTASTATATLRPVVIGGGGRAMGGG